MLNVPGKLRPGQAAPHGATTGYSPKSQKYKKMHLTGREPEYGNRWQVAPAMLSLLQGALGGPSNLLAGYFCHRIIQLPGQYHLHRIAGCISIPVA